MTFQKSVTRTWRSFGRHGVAYSLGEAIGKGLTFGLLVALGLLTSAIDFGYLNLFITMVGLGGVVVAAGIPDGILRFYFSDHAVSRTIRGGLTIVLVLALTGSLVIVLLATDIARALDLPRGLVVLVGLAVPFVALRQTGLAVLRARERGGTYVVVRTAEPIVAVVILCAMWLAQSGYDYRSLMIAFFGGSLVVGTGSLVWLCREAGCRPTFAPARQLLTYSAPLMPHAVAMTGLATIDQLVINQLLGPAQTGQYALAYRFGMAMSLIAFGVAAAWGPLVFSRKEDDAENDLAVMAGTAVNFSLLAAAILCLMLPGVALLFGADPRVASLIPIIVYGYVWVVLYSLLVPHLIFYGHTTRLAAISGTAFTANLVLNYLFVARLGIIAAAAATVVCYALLFGLVWHFEPRGRVELGIARLVGRTVLLLPVVVATVAIFH